jgi:Spy/CpxP family protein refolding chaperone
MDIFTQKKVLIRLVILLLALNFISMGLFIWKGISPRNKPDNNPAQEQKEISLVLKQELHLSDLQTEKIKKLRSGYVEKEKVLVTQIRAERDSMNSIIFNFNADPEMVKSIARRVADNEYKMEMLRFEQSQELKTICTPDQLKKFDRLVREIRDYFQPTDQSKEKRK